MTEELPWRITGEARRRLFRRYIDLQMRHVQEEVFRYVSNVREDMCIGDLTDDVCELVYYSFKEKPKDPKSVIEMRAIWKGLTEKNNDTGREESGDKAST